MVLFGRTDLASEAHGLWRGAEAGRGELDGAALKEELVEGLPVTGVEIFSDSAAETLQKSPGRYYTLSLDGHFERGSELFPAAASALAELLRRCIGKAAAGTVVIAALGNPDITPDAVGSIAASNILVTRHLKESSPEQFRDFCSTALCRTGVLGTTGIESAAQIKNICRELHAELVIAVDALAGADVSRLCRTVQVCDTGIAPGSGVGNSRARLDREALGVPVIAVGVPTVIDASALSREPELSGMFVTPRDIDSVVRSLGRLIGYGINLALHRGLTVSDVDMLVG